MIIATVTALMILLGGGAHWGVNETLENLSKLIGKKVQSEAQVEAAQALIHNTQEEVKSFESLLIDSRRQVWAVDSKYDATAEDYRRAFDSLHSAWDQMEKDLIDTHVTLRDHITKDEWNTIYDELKKKRR